MGMAYITSNFSSVVNAEFVYNLLFVHGTTFLHTSNPVAVYIISHSQAPDRQI